MDKLFLMIFNRQIKH